MSLPVFAKSKEELIKFVKGYAAHYNISLKEALKKIEDQGYMFRVANKGDYDLDYHPSNEEKFK